jgi:hypothetical protein
MDNKAHFYNSIFLVVVTWRTLTLIENSGRTCKDGCGHEISNEARDRKDCANFRNI